MNWSFTMIKKTVATLLITCCSLLSAKQTPALSSKEKPPIKHTSLQKKSEVTASLNQGHINSSEVMLIDPEMRAKDFQSAFDYLKNSNTAAKIFVKLKSGHSISEIISMEVMPQGTLIIFQTNTTQGVKYDVINIENIESIGDG